MARRFSLSSLLPQRSEDPQCLWGIDRLLCARYTDPHVVMRDATPGCPRYPILHGLQWLAPLNDANQHHDDRNDQEQMDESP